ncbi:MAG: bacteriohemerythrin [Hyphomicrobium sp.]
MAFIKWSAAMSVGVSRLDRDHRILIGLINRLDEASEGDDNAAQLMAEVLEVLVSYTIFHFSREEAVMEACGYPALGHHHEEHVALTQEVRDWQKRFRADAESVVPMGMLHFLKGWLNHHILLQDMAYRPFVEGNPAANTVAEAYGLFDFHAAAYSASEADLEDSC